MESALKHNAVSLIFVHNHPSGNPKPSSGYKELTKDLAFAGGMWINDSELAIVIYADD